MKPIAAIIALLVLAPSLAHAVTEHDLRGRIQIDGLTGDFTADEAVLGPGQEPTDDSSVGPNDDIHQIRITWDHRNLYLAGEGLIWDNNIVLAIDAVPFTGIDGMYGLNSWRRGIFFAFEFTPDVFGATWDGNTAPHLLYVDGRSHVADLAASPLFQAAATFSQDSPGRAMELAIPWTTLYLSQLGVCLARDTVIDVGGTMDTVTVIPEGASIAIVGFITGGPDGTGAPDLAPNNASGPSADFSQPALVDNFAIVEIDADHDGVPDAGVEPRSRVQIYNPTTSSERTSWGSLKRRYR